MTKPDLGTKHLCPGCGTKFYDLKRTPITCPKCGTVVSIVAKGATGRSAKAAAAVVPETIKDPVKETKEDVVIVSLEDADAEQIVASKSVINDDDDADDDDIDVVDDVDDVEDIDDEADDTFLEDDEDDDAVPDIIVVRDKEEDL